MNLRVAYNLPDNLASYVGPVGVWGDVNDILQENLICMRVSTHLLLLCFNTVPSSWLVEHAANTWLQALSRRLRSEISQMLH